VGDPENGHLVGQLAPVFEPPARAVTQATEATAGARV
jgi:hypothetical protein